MWYYPSYNAMRSSIYAFHSPHPAASLDSVVLVYTDGINSECLWYSGCRSSSKAKRRFPATLKSFPLSEIEAVIVGSPQVYDKASMVVDHLHSRPRACRIPLHCLSREVCVQDGYPMHARDEYILRVQREDLEDRGSR